MPRSPAQKDGQTPAEIADRCESFLHISHYHAGEEKVHDKRRE